MPWRHRENGHLQTQESSQEKWPCLSNLPITFLSNVCSTLCFHYYHLNLDCVFLIWNIQITISSSSSSFISNIHSHVSKATTLWNCWEWSLLCTLFLSTIYNLWFLNPAVHQNLGGIFFNSLGLYSQTVSVETESKGLWARNWYF